MLLKMKGYNRCVAVFCLLFFYGNMKLWSAHDKVNLQEGNEEIRSELPVHTNHLQARVLIFSYERSGSSFMGEFINRNTDAFYLFEPLFGMYSHLYGEYPGRPSTIYFNYEGSSNSRYAPEFEQTLITRTLYDVMTCNLQRLPVDVLPSFFSLKYNKEESLESFKTCYKTQRENVRKDINTNYLKPTDCKKVIRKHCNRTFNNHTEYKCFESIFRKKFPTHINFKANAFSLDETDNFLTVDSYSYWERFFSGSLAQRFSDHNTCLKRAADKSRDCLPHVINRCLTAKIVGTKIIRARFQHLIDLLRKLPDLKIIHYVRDPRGISNSRIHRYETVAQRLEDIQKTCDKMAEDIVARENLQYMFASNFLVIHYEDLATKPMETLEKAYQFMGVPLNDKLKELAWNSTHNATAVERPMGTVRKNATNTAFYWHNANNTVINKKIEELCKNVMIKLNYL